MNADFINPFLVSLINVISTMANMQLTPGKPRIKKDNIAKGDVSGLIGMIGLKTKGSLSITFELNLVLEIMQNMLGENPGMINEEITDLVGEITNMVTGGAKNILSDKGYDFDMATPVVVSGIDHSISHKANGKKIIMPFTSPYGKAFIEICFEDVDQEPEKNS
ncbi:MAG: chemotaxis protein CheX [Shewanella sp.]|jgi:chemotaxis protein CheX